MQHGKVTVDTPDFTNTFVSESVLLSKGRTRSVSRQSLTTCTRYLSGIQRRKDPSEKKMNIMETIRSPTSPRSSYSQAFRDVKRNSSTVSGLVARGHARKRTSRSLMNCISVTGKKACQLQKQYSEATDSEVASSEPPNDDDLLPLETIDEETTMLADNGYERIEKIRDCLQGEVIKAKLVKYHVHHGIGSHVAIKKIRKKLSWSRTALQDEFTHCVSEDIIKEAVILKHLTVDNSPTGEYIVKFVDLFETADHFFLVTEWVQGMTLQDFIAAAHELMRRDRLSTKEWNKTIKYIMWKLMSILRWLHDVMHCCHLDLTAQNVMITKLKWIEKGDGKVTIDNHITLKLIDFGVAEIFDIERYPTHYFNCNKDNMTITNEIYQAPEVFNLGVDQVAYDARAADMWSLGILFYNCVVGKPLYSGPDMVNNSAPSGYKALHRKTLQQYLYTQGLLKKFNVPCFKLLSRLLDVDPDNRITALGAAEHEWFKSYWRKYKVGLNKKHALDAANLRQQKDKMAIFPYYKLRT